MNKKMYNKKIMKIYLINTFSFKIVRARFGYKSIYYNSLCDSL